MHNKELKELLLKYHRPAGRYALYPHIPQWNNKLTTKEWIDDLKENYDPKEGVDFYLHIPFCESLCTFCGCNIFVTKNRAYEKDYVKALKKEIDFYYENLGSLKVNNLYLGGGTPTYLSKPHLQELLEYFFTKNSKGENFLATAESDPRFELEGKLKILSSFGFTRLSLGIQDLNQEVLNHINRKQSFEQIEKVCHQARENTIEEILFDLVYGLPAQKEETLSITLEQIKKLSPDTIAFYPLGLAPWQKNLQSNKQHDLIPKTEEKYKLFLQGRDFFLKNNMLELGLGHYAKPTSLTGRCYQEKTLRRHIMGFLPYKSPQLIGLGVSSISYSKQSYWQNPKVYDQYIAGISQENLRPSHTHQSHQDETHMQETFERLIVKNEIELPSFIKQEKLASLKSFHQDNLIAFDEKKLHVLPQGKPFMRMICQALEEACQ